MKLRSTLNGRQARTLRDAQRDPYDWIERHRHPAAGIAAAFRVWLVLLGFVAGTVWLAVGGR